MHNYCGYLLHYLPDLGSNANYALHLNAILEVFAFEHFKLNVPVFAFTLNNNAFTFEKYSNTF